MSACLLFKLLVVRSAAFGVVSAELGRLLITPAVREDPLARGEPLAVGEPPCCSFR
jgi:hypothetical protein